MQENVDMQHSAGVVAKYGCFGLDFKPKKSTFLANVRLKVTFILICSKQTVWSFLLINRENVVSSPLHL